MTEFRERIHQVLKDYWGYDEFRSLQEDIILHVLSGKSALALLPTGGGKSICFQVPALVLPGFCLVVSPLIALMQDQVENLKKKGIPAAAIYSGLSSHEVDYILNQAQYGRLKFLYVSPERLQQSSFVTALLSLPVSLIAVDEAHCISQWGYDFRPPYLKIADLKEIFPNVPFLALTATATPDVVEDIQEKLRIYPRKVFSKSFKRDNITYYVIHDEDKMGRLLRIIAKVGGSGIVYVRNRRKTEQIAEYLRMKGISAAAYHAGMPFKERESYQLQWKQGKIQVIAATNAFGMGIDKENVRFVVHLDLPLSIEAYFQEAGRAGRDGKRAFALLLYHEMDKRQMEDQFQRSFPSMDFIACVYEALFDYYGIPLESGKGEEKDFSLKEFAMDNQLEIVKTYNALRFLEREGYFILSEQLRDQSQIKINTDYHDICRYGEAHLEFAPLLEYLMRHFGGDIFSKHMGIYEVEMARRLEIKEAELVSMLRKLQDFEILDYRPVSTKPAILFLESRRNLGTHFISYENYGFLKKVAWKKMKFMIDYAESSHRCRSQYMLSYFGEENSPPCLHCDVCLKRDAQKLTPSEADRLITQIRTLMEQHPVSMEDALVRCKDFREEKVRLVWDYLLEEEKIEAVNILEYRWRT